ncbi:hypothetical protein ASF43_29435 [Pseudorhodoferax sp. Leaf267]|nr:hypothetical protein ASF43_29435 [Pseudorhodoferax sp. Leaf267]
MDADSDAARTRIEFRAIDEPTVAAQMRPQTPPIDASNPSQFATGTGAYEYLIAPGDVLRVTVWEHPELTNPSGTDEELSGRVVTADGRVYFPYAGHVQAAGRTVEQVRSQIERGLSSVIRAPKVDVSVLQYRGQRVYVSGQVRSPGVQPVTDLPPDLADVLGRAGGVTDDADLSAVLVTRGQERARVDLEAMYYRGDLRANLRLRHGDVVNVPERRAARVYVAGEVLRPQRLLMPRGVLTLADALADAGGPNPESANPSQIYVIRDEQRGRPVVYHLDARSPDALILADRFHLQSRDVVYVDTAPVVRWGRLLSNIVPSATLLRESLNDSTRGLPR